MWEESKKLCFGWSYFSRLWLCGGVHLPGCGIGSSAWCHDIGHSAECSCKQPISDTLTVQLLWMQWVQWHDGLYDIMSSQVLHVGGDCQLLYSHSSMLCQLNVSKERPQELIRCLTRRQFKMHYAFDIIWYDTKHWQYYCYNHNSVHHIVHHCATSVAEPIRWNCRPRSVASTAI